jgi:TetR/AcrR family transcriptional repressor of nem operon
MKSAGLTHGGFYVHFKNRDQLVAEAVDAAAAETAAGTFADDVRLEGVLDRYLSSGHLRTPAVGCVVAAIGTDGARQSKSVRKSFARAARGLIALVDDKLHPDRARNTLSDQALRVTATMVGAVVLGRLIDDPELAERILRAARNSALE